jgi:hypothetical protein
MGVVALDVECVVIADRIPAWGGECDVPLGRFQCGLIGVGGVGWDESSAAAS